MQSVDCVSYLSILCCLVYALPSFSFFSFSFSLSLSPSYLIISCRSVLLTCTTFPLSPPSNIYLFRLRLQNAKAPGPLPHLNGDTWPPRFTRESLLVHIFEFEEAICSLVLQKPYVRTYACRKLSKLQKYVLYLLHEWCPKSGILSECCVFF